MFGTIMQRKLPWLPARAHSVPADQLEEVAEKAFLQHTHFVRFLRFAGISAVAMLIALVFGIWAGRISHRPPGPVTPVVSSEHTTLIGRLRQDVRNFLLGDR